MHFVVGTDRRAVRASPARLAVAPYQILQAKLYASARRGEHRYNASAD
jgi:hypothetical protein